MSQPTVALDWEARFQAEATPWERPALHPAYLSWRESGALRPQAAPGAAAHRVLVPCAGRSAEPLAFAEAGFAVTIVDVAPSAIAWQQAHFAKAGLAGQVIAADLFAYVPAAPFDAVYDQTCLCALPPSSWEAYVAKLARWVRPGGALFMLFMQTGRPGGPPYDCATDQMRGLFSASLWHWPETLAAPIGHSVGGMEQPAILTRLP